MVDDSASLHPWIHGYNTQMVDHSNWRTFRRMRIHILLWITVMGLSWYALLCPSRRASSILSFLFSFSLKYHSKPYYIHQTELPHSGKVLRWYIYKIIQMYSKKMGIQAKQRHRKNVRFFVQVKILRRDLNVLSFRVFSKSWCTSSKHCFFN